MSMPTPTPAEPLFQAKEYHRDSLVPTGRIEYYTGPTQLEAASRCLYTHQLHDGHSRLGKTGRVVHAGAFIYVVTKEPA